MTSGWQNIARLPQMDWAEIRTRLAQALSKRCDLLRHQFGMPPETIALRDSSATGKFFFAPGEAHLRAELFKQYLPDQAAEIIHEAEAICEHRFHLLGYENVDCGTGEQDDDKSIDWHLDPIHHKRAPLVPWFKIPFLDFAVVGDHKITWELNRQQHLVVLAKAWLLIHNERFIRELRAQWHSWIKANPYPLGINWASSLEVAFRSLSWIWIDHLLMDAPGHVEFRAELLPSLAFHGRYIERYLSSYFSPNTHLLGEAVAMFFLGTLYPQMPHAPHWKEDGWKILLREAERQVRGDGVYFEQSLYYHVYALDFFLYARVLAAANDIHVPAAYDEVLARMLHVIDALAQAGPAEGFGDDDGGRLFNSRRNQTEHMTDPLAIGSLALKHADFAAAQLTEESVWLFGKHAVAVLAPVQASHDATPAKSQPANQLISESFANGGLYLLADSDPCPQVIMIDAGPQGTGRCGHGHADALSVRLTMNGSRWLVDSGSGVYISSDRSARNAFRGTAAHNTLRIDGLDQSIPGEPFSWTDIPMSRAENWVLGRTFTYFSGSHDGYSRLNDGVTHRRSVLRVNGCANNGIRNERAGSDGVWLVRDVLLGQAEHEVELNWHFASEVLVREASPSALIASRPETNQPTLHLIWPNDSAFKVQVTNSQLSPAYGCCQSAPLARAQAHVKLPAEIVTVFLVQSHAAKTLDQGRLVSVRNPVMQAYELTVGEENHGFFFARDKRPWSFGPWSSDAEFLYCRIKNEKLMQLILIGGSSVEWQNRPLLSADSPSKYFEWRKEDCIQHAEPAILRTTSSFDELTANSPSSHALTTISSYVEKC